MIHEAPHNQLNSDATEDFESYIQQHGMVLSPAEMQKYRDYEGESKNLSASFLGKIYTNFTKIFQEDSIFTGIKKAFSKASVWVDDGCTYDAFKKDYERFDALANYYGGLYRGSFVFNYFMGAVAVLAALIPVGFGFEHMDPHIAHIATPAMTVFELLAIVFIYAIHKRGATHHGSHSHGKSGKRWHQRWLEYRLLAERFRYMELLYPLGLDPRKIGVAHHQRHEWTWMDAYLGYRLKSTPSFENTDQKKIDNRLKYLIEDQLSYHEKNARRMGNIHHKLHTCASGLFFLTFLSCVAHLVWHNAILTLFSGFFPALAASCHGIIANGEFIKNEDISKKMVHELKSIKTAAEKIETDEQRCDVVTALHNLVINDALGWRAIFNDKNVPLA